MNTLVAHADFAPYVEAPLLPSRAGEGLAVEAASRARVAVRPLRNLDELAAAEKLLRNVGALGAFTGQTVVPVTMLEALASSGNYVAGAWRGRSLIGVAVGLLSEHRGQLELRSHAVGVSRADQGLGVGLALKFHQRAWALNRGIATITWTYDPIDRRNSWFNLAKLRARATAYYPNLHGVLTDEVNGGDETDRCLMRWSLDRPLAIGSAVPVPPPDAAVALISSATHTPIVNRVPLDGHLTLMCQVPEDVVSWRRRDPGLAREWRMALRHTMGRALDCGYSATSMTRDGWFVLERPAEADI